MDSDVIREGIMIDVVDAKWREEKLPDEDIAVPLMELPDPEPDNSNIHETLREQEQKWADLALNRLHEQPTATLPNWKQYRRIHREDFLEQRSAVHSSSTHQVLHGFWKANVVLSLP